MIDRAGVELGAETIRAVAPSGWRGAPRCLEVPWDPSRPEGAVATLRAELGDARRLALVVGLPFLHPKRVSLPPASPEARRAMLALEPDRFFPLPSSEPVLVSLLHEQSLVFAVEEARVERWIAAFERWAPVESVEPAPLAAARALLRAGDGVYRLDAGPGEEGLLEIASGRVASVRRVPAVVGAPVGRALPATGGVAPEFVPAREAARGADVASETMLLPERRAAAVRSRRTARGALHAVACAVALVLALWAVDRSRERTATLLNHEVAVADSAAAPAIALRDRLAALDLEAAALAGASRDGNPDPLPVLAALSERLPSDATVLSARLKDGAWQIDGTASDAAGLVPLLDGDRRFRDVHVLSASSRYREGDRTYETFSIAFRAANAPSD